MKIFIPWFVSFILLFSLPSYAQTGNITSEKVKSINGTELYLKVMGEGEPLLIVHGGPGLNHSYFLPHMETLAEEFHLIFFDQRACGKSSVKLDSTQISLDLFVDDIEAIRKELDLGKIHLMAHSWGGFLAMNYATRYPEQLQSLILSNTTPASSELNMQMMRSQMQAMTKKDSLDRARLMNSESFQQKEITAFEKLMKLSFRMSFRDTTKIGDLTIDLGSNYLQGSQLLQYLAPDLTSYDLHPALSNIDIATLIIYGQADLIPLASDQKLNQTIPNSSIAFFEDSGHFPFVEEPQKFTREISTFIEGLQE